MVFNFLVETNVDRREGLWKKQSVQLDTLGVEPVIPDREQQLH